MVEEDINFNILNDVNNNNVEQTYNENSPSSLNIILKKTKEKLSLLLNNPKTFENFQILQEIIDNNLYVPSNFKTKQFGMDINIDFFLPKYVEEKKIIKQESNSYDNNQNRNISFKTGNISEDYMPKKSNQQKKVIINPNINFNTFIIKGNNDLDKITSNINLQNSNNNNNMKLLGNKRNLDEKDKNNIEKQAIYEEIKEIYNNYKKNENINKNKQKEIKIIETFQGYLSKYDTLIIDNKTICIVYFDSKIITNIYLVGEGLKVEDDKMIIEILTKIRNDLKIDK